MPKLEPIQLDVITTSDGKGIDEAEKNVLGFSEKAQKSFLAISGMVAGAATAVGAFALSTIKDFTAQEDANARLVAGLKNVGATQLGLADGTQQMTVFLDNNTKALYDQASALQKTTRFADEQIISGQAMLTTFQLSGQTIKTLTPHMLDMAEAMRQTTGETVDLNSLGIMFGKVMGNAEGGVEGLATGLKKMGVIMTDEQAAVFKFGTETERAATLSKIMDDNFKGFATAGGATFSGQMDIMNNQIGEVKESIGGMVANALGPLVSFISANVVPVFEQFTGWLQTHKEIATAVALVIGTVVVASFIALGVAAVSALTAITVAGAPIFLLVAGIGLVIGALYLAWTSNFLGIQEITQTVFTVVQNVVGGVVNWFMTYAWPVIQQVLNFIGAALTTLGQIFTNIFNLIIKPLLGAFVTYFNVTFWQPIKAIFDLMTGALHSMGLTWGDVWEGIKKVVFGILGAIVDEVKSKINFIIKAINFMINGANSVGSKIAGFTKINTLPELATGVNNFAGGMALVGERGPELVNLPKGSDVIPNNQLRGLVGGNGSTDRPIQVTQYIQDSVDLTFAFRELAYAIKTS